MRAPLQSGLFERVDDSEDRLFYGAARLVTHIDDATIEALRSYYEEVLTPGSDILDLMSSCVSHLPDTVFARVAGLGMNAEELAANPRLDDWCVHDLNVEPELPYEDASFDAVLIAVSVQYLTRPVEVFRAIARVLRPGGHTIVAMSHRCFPTKAVRAFQVFGRDERMALVASYHEHAETYTDVSVLDRSPPGADPLWLVTARRRSV